MIQCSVWPRLDKDAELDEANKMPQSCTDQCGYSSEARTLTTDSCNTQNRCFVVMPIRCMVRCSYSVCVRFCRSCCSNIGSCRLPDAVDG